MPRTLLAVRTGPKSFRVGIVATAGGVAYNISLSEEAAIGSSDRLLVYDPETEQLQVRTAAGISRDEPLGHMIVLRTISLADGVADD